MKAPYRRGYALAVLAAVIAGVSAPSWSQKPLSPEDRAAIFSTVDAIWNAILGARPEELLQLISPARGLACQSKRYSYADVQRHYLFDSHSILYMSLFDSSGFARTCGKAYPSEYPAISDRDFLRTAEKSSLVTEITPDLVRVTLATPVPNEYPRTWYLHREGQSWKLNGESFAIGDCACGAKPHDP